MRACQEAVPECTLPCEEEEGGEGGWWKSSEDSAPVEANGSNVCRVLRATQ